MILLLYNNLTECQHNRMYFHWLLATWTNHITVLYFQVVCYFLIVVNGLKLPLYWLSGRVRYQSIIVSKLDVSSVFSAYHKLIFISLYEWNWDHLILFQVCGRLLDIGQVFEGTRQIKKSSSLAFTSDPTRWADFQRSVDLKCLFSVFNS